MALDDSSCAVAVVGGGIVGLAVARELQRRRPGQRVVVLEQEAAPARHQTGSSSGVVHAGVYYAPGSLKARLCVEGARELAAFCAEHGVPVERCGKVIVATRRGELDRLSALEARAHANGVRGLRRIGPDELAAIEPHATGIAALYSPETAVVDFAAVARALAADLVAAGGELVTGCRVEGLVRRRGVTVVRHAGGELQVRRVVACAGAWADRVGVAAGGAREPRVIPFRGAYLRLRPETRGLVRALIYPVPDPRLPFLGVHLTRRIDGEVLLGPTALVVGARDAYALRTVRARDLRDTLVWPGTWRMAARWWRTGLRELHLAASRRALVSAGARYVPELTINDVLDGPAGIRAQAVGRDGALIDDFLVEETPGAVHVRNAPSPAATSSLALARLIADRVEAAGE